MLPLLFLLLLLLRLCASPREAAALTRDAFPEGFVFGAGTSAYQVEGAVDEDGRKPSILDTFTHQGYLPDKATGDIAADQYHHYKDDVKLMHKMGLDAYRFSIAWPRLIPDGSGKINPKGLKYYNNLINELLQHDIEPHVTLYHFDLPQAIQDRYDGFLSPRFVDDFTAYADACFKNFGDRVKHWVTLNEPNIEIIGGFDTGVLPPQRCSYPFGTNCSAGDSTTEPYTAAHHLLLAHASAVSLYRDKYQANQTGKIGITLMAEWYEPASDTARDSAAAKRANDFQIGWFMHPLVYGEYPPTMRSRVGTRLPKFTAEQSKNLSGSCDFIGLNHYNVIRVRANEKALGLKQRDYNADTAAVEANQEGGSREHAPWALGKLLEHVRVEYGNPPVMIHENGYADNPKTPSEIEYDDNDRLEFLQDYIEVLYMSIQNGSDAQGYFVWSFLDLFEILSGFRARYGICGVDMNSKERRRYIRKSGHWYSGFLNGTELRPASLSRKAYAIE